MVRKKERERSEECRRRSERVEIYKKRNKEKQTKEGKSRSREDGASYAEKAAAKFCKLAHLTTHIDTMINIE